MSTPAKENFGPLIGVPAKDILPTNFDCPSCGNRVRKFLKFIRQYNDSMWFFSCGCTTAVNWELENPPNCAEHWKRLTQLQKRYGRDIVVLTPEASAELHGQRNN
jgi:hypothetical protein